MRGGESCSVCANPHREAIDLQLRSGISVRNVAKHFGIPRSTIGDHKTRCLGHPIPTVSLPAEAEQAIRALAARPTTEPKTSAELVGQLDALISVVTVSLNANLANGKLSLPIVRELRAALDSAAKLRLAIEERNPKKATYAVTAADFSPEERQAKLRALMVKALSRMPTEEVAALQAEAQAAGEAEATAPTVAQRQEAPETEQPQAEMPQAEKAPEPPAIKPAETFEDLRDRARNQSGLDQRAWERFQEAWEKMR